MRCAIGDALCCTGPFEVRRRFPDLEARPRSISKSRRVRSGRSYGCTFDGIILSLEQTSGSGTPVCGEGQGHYVASGSQVGQEPGSILSLLVLDKVACHSLCSPREICSCVRCECGAKGSLFTKNLFSTSAASDDQLREADGTRCRQGRSRRIGESSGESCAAGSARPEAWSLERSSENEQRGATRSDGGI